MSKYTRTCVRRRQHRASGDRRWSNIAMWNLWTTARRDDDDGSFVAAFSFAIIFICITIGERGNAFFFSSLYHVSIRPELRLDNNNSIVVCTYSYLCRLGRCCYCSAGGGVVIVVADRVPCDTPRRRRRRRRRRPKSPFVINYYYYSLRTSCKTSHDVPPSFRPANNALSA